MVPGPASLSCCSAMRQKGFYLLLTCIALACLFMVLIPVQKPRTLHNIVKETQKKILDLHQNLLASAGGVNLQVVPNNPDAQYLQLLGLPPYPLHLEPPGVAEELLIVSAVASGQLHHVYGFIYAALHVQTEASILIHDLGLSRKDKESLNEMCNSTQCQVSEFKFSNWPNHVKDLKLQAFRPILIQLGLRESTSLLWMDIDTRIVHTTNIVTLLEKVKTSFILTWPEQPAAAVLKDGGGGPSSHSAPTPTTALTHQRMFEYFPQTQKEDYEFQHMITGKCLLFNLGPLQPTTDDHHQKQLEPASNSLLHTGSSTPPHPPLITSLMVPWLKCVLIEDCINPIGAQSTGCRFDKKPKYRYSGCHSYDVSALNIVLGEMFSFRETVYTSNPS
jgi:hypothetical protein